MAVPKTGFLEKVLGRIGRLDKEGLQTVVERLARERAFLETLFNTIEDGVLVVDENGRVLYLNHAVSRLLGLAENSAEGQHVSRILPELEWEKLLRADKKGGSRLTRLEFEVQYPRSRFVSLYAAPLDGEAVGSSGVALILHDATETRQRTHEAVESERIQALTLLAASVAHEIGNPLNALHIHLQLMERELARLVAGPGDEAGLNDRGSTRKRGKVTAMAGPSPERLQKLAKYLDVCKGEISRLDYTVTQFLAAIRPSVPQIRRVSINEVVRDAVELLRPEIENRGITIRQNLFGQVPPSPLDPGQIKQVLVNLMKNAIQAMTGGGMLTIETNASPEGVMVSIGDTGGGIPADHLKRIFEPFYTTKKKGSGLGLMIVKRIIQDHRGQIKIESHVGQGTIFRIWLPLYERQTRLIEARHD